MYNACEMMGVVHAYVQVDSVCTKAVRPTVRGIMGEGITACDEVCTRSGYDEGITKNDRSRL